MILAGADWTGLCRECSVSSAGKHLGPTHRAKYAQADSRRLVSWLSGGSDDDSMRHAWPSAILVAVAVGGLRVGTSSPIYPDKAVQSERTWNSGSRHASAHQLAVLNVFEVPRGISSGPSSNYRPLAPHICRRVQHLPMFPTIHRNDT